MILKSSRTHAILPTLPFHNWHVAFDICAGLFTSLTMLKDPMSCRAIV
jgi:hypothetical protein